MRSDSEPAGQEGFSFIAEARREQIKKAAIDTIVELGYAKASLAQIAKRAGISKGVISYHFAGKDELMEKLVVEFYVAGAHFMLPHLEVETTARGVLLRYIEKNISYIGDNRHAIVAISDILLNFRDADGTLHFGHDGHNELVEAVAQILREGQEKGEFGDFDPVVMGSSIRASIDMVSAALHADPDADTAHYARELMTLFDRATRKDPS
ncbi:TetR family transcriptional regulator [Saccharopolyspora erythraea]|uniref:TetR/AcrR family transcriptional regulator n=1 Tax=Saccharopolyspora erythraea TaxID=1836 RepID=UPI001BA9064D|nr:TetR/AcrR family transcriptional regulator [Saccharopolyspora erythraea]QUH04556.1 TetR family transcriptional regulator [Saccharopolyspora erythraea]